jgi:methionine-rich copper-binding protein CopC
MSDGIGCDPVNGSTRAVADGRVVRGRIGRPGTARPGLRRLGTAVFALGAILLSVHGAAPAAAHTELASSDPFSGATLEAAPMQVTLTFRGQITRVGVTVQVTGPDGAVGAGPAVVAGRTVTQPLAAGLPAGTYDVRWQVTAGDGHPISGSLHFTVAANAAPSTEPAVAPTATPTIPPQPVASAPSALAKAQPSPTSLTGSLLGGGGDEASSTTIAVGIIAMVLIALTLLGLALRRRGNGPRHRDGGGDGDSDGDGGGDGGD